MDYINFPSANHEQYSFLITQAGVGANICNVSLPFRAQCPFKYHAHSGKPVGFRCMFLGICVNRRDRLRINKKES